MKARISVLDHAVLYGDGIFETAAAYGGRIFKLDAHIEFISFDEISAFLDTI